MVTNKLNASFFCYTSDGPVSESVKTIFADNYFEELFSKISKSINVGQHCSMFINLKSKKTNWHAVSIHEPLAGSPNRLVFAFSPIS